MPLFLTKRKYIEGQHHSLLAKDLVLIGLVLPEAKGTKILKTTLGTGKVHRMSPEGL